jgi:hypothetical protein
MRKTPLNPATKLSRAARWGDSAPPTDGDWVGRAVPSAPNGWRYDVPNFKADNSPRLRHD